MKLVALFALPIITLQAFAVGGPLNFIAPQPRPALTQNQIQQIRQEFGNGPGLVLPAGQLLFPKQHESSEERAKRESEEALLKSEDLDSFQTLKNIRSGCVATRPSLNFESTFALDKIEPENLRADDSVRLHDTAGIRGENCPFSSTASTDSEVKIENIDTGSRHGTVIAHTKSGARIMIQNPMYAQKLAARGLIVDSNAGAIYSERNGSRTAYGKATFSGHVYSLRNDLPYTISVEASGAGVTSVPMRWSGEIVIREQIQFPQFSIDLVVHGQKILKDAVEIYVNGNRMTVSQVQSLFGVMAPADLVQKMGFVEGLQQ